MTSIAPGDVLIQRRKDYTWYTADSNRTLNTIKTKKGDVATVTAVESDLIVTLLIKGARVLVGTHMIDDVFDRMKDDTSER